MIFMKYCPKCGKRYDDSWKICLNCQTTLQKTTEPKEDYEGELKRLIRLTTDTKICPKCKKTYDNTWEICMRCNTKLINGANSEDATEIRREIEEIKNTVEALNERSCFLKKVLAEIQEKGEIPDIKVQIREYKKKIEEEKQKQRKHVLKEEEIKEIVAETKKCKKEKQNIEQIVAKTIFSIVGTIFVAFGFVVLSYAYFVKLPLLAKISVCYLAGLIMIVSGQIIEKNEKLSVFGKTIIAGGWGLAYFLTYIIHHSPNARLIENPILATFLLLGVSIAAIFHLYRYKSEFITGLAYFLVFLTIMVSPVSIYTVMAAIPIALSLLFFMHRFKWFAFGLYGASMTYLINLWWVGSALKAGMSASQFFVSEIFIGLFWLIFTFATFLIKEDDNLKNQHIRIADDFIFGIRELLFLINGAAATFLAFFIAQKGFSVYLNNLLGIALGLYLVLTVLSYNLKKRGMCILSSTFLIGFAFALSFLNYSGYFVMALIIVIAQLIFLSGIKFKEAYWRMFGMISFIVILAVLLMGCRVFIKNAVLN